MLILSTDHAPLTAQTLLHLLHLHLDPPAHLAHLSTVLDILAVFQQLSHALIAEAQRAYDASAAQVVGLMARGVPRRKWARMGALWTSEGEVVKRVMRRWRRTSGPGAGTGTKMKETGALGKGRGHGRDESEEEDSCQEDVDLGVEDDVDLLVALSFEIRLAHIAKAVADGLPLEAMCTLIDTYFPCSSAISANAPLFIRALAPADAPMLDTFRAMVLPWMALVRSGAGADLASLAGASDGNLPAIARSIMKEARRVVDDARDLHAIFAATAVKLEHDDETRTRASPTALPAEPPSHARNPRADKDDRHATPSRNDYDCVPVQCATATAVSSSLSIKHESVDAPSAAGDASASLPPRISFAGRKPARTPSGTFTPRMSSSPAAVSVLPKRKGSMLLQDTDAGSGAGARARAEHLAHGGDAHLRDRPDVRMEERRYKRARVEVGVVLDAGGSRAPSPLAREPAREAEKEESQTDVRLRGARHMVGSGAVETGGKGDSASQTSPGRGPGRKRLSGGGSSLGRRRNI